MALGDEVAQRVHDQPQHARMDRIQRVAGAGEVHVVARVVGHQAVVGGVVDPLEGEHRTQVVALGGVVVDDIEDHLDSLLVQGLHHALELAHLLAAAPGGRVLRVGGEVADRAVAPVVAQAPFEQERLVGDVVHGQQLDRGHAQVLEVGDRRLGGQPGVGPAQVLTDLGVGHGEALDVGLVDDGVGERDPWGTVALPQKASSITTDLGTAGESSSSSGSKSASSLPVGDIGQHVGVVAPVDHAFDRLGVGVDQQLVGVEAVTLVGLVGPCTRNP